MCSRIVVFNETGVPLSIKYEKLPDLKKGEILVKIDFTTLCRSDLNTISGKRKEKTPTIPGHEIAGRIIKIADQVRIKDERGQSLSKGDLITWAIFASNPESEMSKKGIPQKSDDLFKYGHEKITETNNFHGGLADHIILRKNTPVVKVNNSLPLPLVAIINCAVATVAGSLRLAGLIKGCKVVVSGTGMLGTIACAMAHFEGARQVTAIDTDRKRLETSKLFGASHTFHLNEKNHHQQLPKGDIYLEYSGNKTAMENSVPILNTGGTAIWVGATFPQENLNLDAEKIIRKIITIKGLHNYNRDDLIAAVEFMEKTCDRYPFPELIKDGFSLESVNEAFQYAIKENPYRVGLKI